MFVYYFSFCLALQTDNSKQKITQPVFVLGNFVNQNEKRKMGWKAHRSNLAKFFVCFLEELRTRKFASEINWPLVRCNLGDDYGRAGGLTFNRISRHNEMVPLRGNYVSYPTFFGLFLPIVLYFIHICERINRLRWIKTIHLKSPVYN